MPHLLLLVTLLQTPPPGHPLQVAERLAAGDVQTLAVVAAARGDRALMEKLVAQSEGRVVLVSEAAQAGWLDLAEAELNKAPARLATARPALAKAYATAGRGGDAARIVKALPRAPRKTAVSDVLNLLTRRGEATTADAFLAGLQDPITLSHGIIVATRGFARRPTGLDARLKALRMATNRLPAEKEIEASASVATQLASAGLRAAALRWARESGAPQRAAALVALAPTLARTQPDDPADLELAAFWATLNTLPAADRPLKKVLAPFIKHGRLQVLAHWGHPQPSQQPATPKATPTLSGMLAETTDPDALVGVAEVALDMGRFDLARQALLKAEPPEAVDGQSWGLVWARLGDLDRTTGALPRLPDDQAEYFAEAAAIALENGHHTVALGLAEALARVGPQPLPDEDDCSPLEDYERVDGPLGDLVSAAAQAGRYALGRDIAGLIEQAERQADSLIEVATAQAEMGAVDAALDAVAALGEPIVPDACSGERLDIRSAGLFAVADVALAQEHGPAVLRALELVRPEAAADVPDNLGELAQPLIRQARLGAVLKAVGAWPQAAREVGEAQVLELLIDLGHDSAAIDLALTQRHRSRGLAQVGAAMWRRQTPVEPDDLARLQALTE